MQISNLKDVEKTILEWFNSATKYVFLTLESKVGNLPDRQIVRVYKKLGKYQICVNPAEDHFGPRFFLSEWEETWDFQNLKSLCEGKLVCMDTGFEKKDGGYPIYIAEKNGKSWILKKQIFSKLNEWIVKN